MYNWIKNFYWKVVGQCCACFMQFSRADTAFLWNCVCAINLLHLRHSFFLRAMSKFHGKKGCKNEI